MNIGELAKFRGGIATDTISEVTSASGVTIDSVLCKDGSVTGAASGTFTTTYVKAADTQGLALVNSSGTSVVTVSDAGAATVGPVSGNVSHTFYTGANGGGEDGVSIQTASVLATNGDNNVIKVFGKSTSTPDAVLGSYKHSGITNATGYLILTTQDAVLNFIWVDDSDQLRISTSSSHIGTTSGTVVGTQTSDERTKENIQECSKGLETILALQPLEFDQFGTHKTGFVAQRTQLTLPEAVIDTGEKSFGEEQPNKLAMDYTQIIAPMVKSIQEQQAMIEALQAEVAALKAK